MNTVAAVKIWNRKVGAVLWDESKNVGVFEFDKNFKTEELKAEEAKNDLEKVEEE